jgi:hypothetical protein
MDGEWLWNFLAHLTQRVMWAIVTTERPSSVVRRPSSVRPLTFHILINSSEATGPIWTKLWWKQLCVKDHPMIIVQFCSNTFAISEKLITQFPHIVALKAFQLTKKTFKVLSNGQFDFHYIIHQFLCGNCVISFSEIANVFEQNCTMIIGWSFTHNCFCCKN